MKENRYRNDSLTNLELLILLILGPYKSNFKFGLFHCQKIMVKAEICTLNFIKHGDYLKLGSYVIAHPAQP